jgi:hypothetical protein
MKFFSQKRTLPVVELTHFWIVEITQVKHLTYLYIPCLEIFYSIAWISLTKIFYKFPVQLKYSIWNKKISVTIARAVELKHNPGLISSLAFETSKMYTTAADSLATLDQKVFGHWRQYFVLKTKFYQAYVSK